MAIKHLSVARFKPSLLTDYDSEAVYINFRMWITKTNLQPREFLLFSECLVHANTPHVQFPIMLWCQNESTTLNREGESASSLCCSPGLLWLPLLVWLRLSNLIELLKKDLLPHFGKEQICLEIRCCYRWLSPSKFELSAMQSGNWAGAMRDCVSDEHCCYCSLKLKLEWIISTRMTAIT